MSSLLQEFLNERFRGAEPSSERLNLAFHLISIACERTYEIVHSHNLELKVVVVA